MLVNTSEGLISAIGYGAGAISVFASPVVELDLLATSPDQFGSDALPTVPPGLASLQPFALGHPAPQIRCGEAAGSCRGRRGTSFGHDSLPS